MGYGGKYVEQARARELRAQSWTLNEIATELGVAKSSVSTWVRDVEFTPKPRHRGHPGIRPHPHALRKEAQLAACATEATEWLGEMSERDLTMFALGLYAGEGHKSGTEAAMANTNPMFLLIFVTWLRRVFAIDESRLRVVLYLHDDLDLGAAESFWSKLLDIPLAQFTKPYRAAADGSRRRSKHVNGCATVRYSCSLTARRVMAMIGAVAFSVADPG